MSSVEPAWRHPGRVSRAGAVLRAAVRRALGEEDSRVALAPVG